jgi:hypothetical protein
MKAKFPSLRLIQDWCAGANSIDNNLIISNSRDSDSGSVAVGFRVETNVVSVSTKLTDLGIDDGADAVKPSECDVLIDLKKFLKILKGIARSPSTPSSIFTNKKSLRLYFRVPSASAMTSPTYVLNATTR